MIFLPLSDRIMWWRLKAVRRIGIIVRLASELLAGLMAVGMQGALWP